MRTILIIDSNQKFLHDIESRFLLDAPDDLDFVLSSDFDDIEGQIEEDSIDMVVFNMTDYDNFLDMDFQKKVPVVSYARKSEQLMHSQRLGIPSYGIISKATVLIKKIADNEIMKFNEKEKQTEEKQLEEKPNHIKNTVSPNTQIEDTFDEDTFDEDTFDEDDLFGDDFDDIPPRGQRTSPRKIQKDVKPFKEIRKVEEKKEPVKEEIPIKKRNLHVTEPKPVKEELPKEENQRNRRVRRSIPVENPSNNKPIEEKKEVSKRNDRISPSRKRMENIKNIDNNEKTRRKPSEQSQINRRLNQEVNRELNIEKAPAKIITVYSAKGGVGKTTIACELASALALTNHGRGKMSVCIVDYNIDFGDVLITLNYSPKKTCMSYWASDIRETLAGTSEETVQYTQEEIRKQFLQKNEESGLYALLAPFTNEDSMDITETELRIMLENLRDNGGFDYIICDTGNNTRDSSYIALEMADQVLMVLTQSVNTFNCNDTFLVTMNKIHFDMNKFAIIINKVRPKKLVNISAEEVEESIINPNTKRPYPCYAKIEDNTDVMKANNDGRPLVYDSGNKFTQQIRTIISKVAGEQYVLAMPEQKKKKGFFSFFRK